MQMSPIDKHVGQQLYMRRVRLGITQKRLGSMIGASAQQIQKYEKGANSLAGHRLYEVSVALKIDSPIARKCIVNLIRSLRLRKNQDIKS